MIKIDQISDFESTDAVVKSQLIIFLDAIESFPEPIEYLEQFLRGCEVHLTLSLNNTKSAIAERNGKLFSLDEIWYSESIATLLLLSENDGSILFRQISVLLKNIAILEIDTSYLVFDYP